MERQLGLRPADLAQLFASMPTAYLVLTPDLAVVTANAAWTALLGRSLDEMVGRAVFDVFPPDPATVDADGRHPALASLEWARETGQADRPPLMRYDINDRHTGRPSARFWSVINTPVTGTDGATRFLLQRVEDVTDYVQQRHALPAAVADTVAGSPATAGTGAEADADDAADTVWQRRYEVAEADLFARANELRAAVRGQELSARRLTALADAALKLAATDSLEEMAETVAAAGFSALGADGGVITVRDDARGVSRLAITESLGEAARVQYAELDLNDPLPAPWVARTGQQLLLPDAASQLAWSPAMARALETTGRQAWAVLPLRVGDRLLGSVAAAWTRPRRFDDSEVELLRAFAAQCAQTVDRLQVREAERQTAAVNRQMAEALQRSLLSEPPRPDHLQVAVRYLAAGAHAQVGGDWYDAFVTESGDTTVVIGDVAGHDRNAAAAMAQMRNLLRGVAQSTAETPARVLMALDRTLHHLQVDELATAVLGQVRPARDHAGAPVHLLHWSNAGHPPPLLVLADGTASYLVTEPDLLLGVAATVSRAEHQVVLPAGATVVLYTDGLVERRGEHLDVGLRRLRESAGRLASLPVEGMCDALLQQLVPHQQADDVALLALRVRPQPSGPTGAVAGVATGSTKPSAPAPPTPPAPNAAAGPPPGLLAPRGAAQSVLLAATPAAVRQARVLVRQVCTEAGVDAATSDNVVLLTSETVTNAYIHGRSEARLTVTATPQRVRVEVSDDNSRHPRTVERDADALDGRGVDIVGAVSSRWGVIDRSKGKTVWFEVEPGEVEPGDQT